MSRTTRRLAMVFPSNPRLQDEKVEEMIVDRLRGRHMRSANGHVFLDDGDTYVFPMHADTTDEAMHELGCDMVEGGTVFWQKIAAMDRGCPLMDGIAVDSACCDIDSERLAEAYGKPVKPWEEWLN